MLPNQFAQLIVNTGYYIAFQKRPTASFGFIGNLSVKLYKEAARRVIFGDPIDAIKASPSVPTTTNKRSATHKNMQNVKGATMNYQINEGKFNLPEAWQDQSVNAFTLPNNQVNFVISRMPVVEGVNAEDFYHQMIHQFESLTQYHLTEHRQFELHNQVVHCLEYDWKSPESHIYQLAVLWIVGKQLLSFTFTSTIPLTESQKDYLLSIVYSFEPTTE